ncbi:MAG: M14 family zinc carboxypeptidase [Candidatus Heimdallarchaeaceae archaeon]|jgi:hypothetical protein
MVSLNGKLKSILILFVIMVLIVPSINVSSASSVDIEVIIYPELVRDWEDIALIYDNHFHNSTQVFEEINRLHDHAPEIIDMEVIGHTYLGKNITSLRITNEKRTYEKAKTLVVSHHHGREQITIETALRFIVHLLNNYQKNELITKFIDTQEIYVIPALNLDALDLVVDGEDFWLRKNLRPFNDDNDTLTDEDNREDTNVDGKVSSFDVYDNTNPADPVYLYTYYEGIDNDLDGKINEDMVGYTDLNRNYDSYWRNGSGWSADTQSQIYSGHEPFSEPETQAFRDFALEHKFAMAYSLHSGINATFFTDDEKGWAEPNLYWQMVLDYRDILPPSYTSIYINPESKNKPISESAVLAGSWDSWMYFERDTLAPITFEIYRNASSVAPGAETVFEENSTHLILEWTEIYGYFTPDKEGIRPLWNDIKPGFIYLLNNTPSLDIEPRILSGGSNQGDEINFRFRCKNPSLRINTIEPVDLHSVVRTFQDEGVILAAGEERNVDVSMTLLHSITESEYPIAFGNDFVGYQIFNLKKKTSTSLIVGLSVAGLAIIGGIGGTLFFLRRR